MKQTPYGVEDKVTEAELAEMRRIQKKMENNFYVRLWNCHQNDDYCHKCGHGFPG